MSARIMPTVGYGCSGCELSEDGSLWICSERCDVQFDVTPYLSAAEAEEARLDWLAENDLDAL